ncbi:MAG: hypothetical protein HQL18_00955 [Candidatus Omnitrophica bacterium]|nr:hypothetical protein [Candidatus Omnitrophota bacterium]
MVRNLKRTGLFRIVAVAVITAFVTMIPAQSGFAQVVVQMPPAGQIVHLSSHFEPAQMAGLRVNLKDPFSFYFVMDKGERPMADDVKRQEYQKLIKYFLASLTIPNSDMWVNLSPHESNRIIPDNFAETEMGRDLLAQDYILKQLTASLIYPEDNVGREFWQKIYSQAKEKFGTIDIPVDTFNKVWIMADNAEIYQKDDTAFLVKSHLKVMMEQDFMAVTQNKEQFGNVGADAAAAGTDEQRKMAADIVREVIVPVIEKEVNEGENFSQVRQVYSAMIMANWFKKTLKESLLGQVYADKSKVAGIEVNDPQAKERIYQQYLQAYKVGVFNYIKEEADPLTNEVLPRKYFSGGLLGGLPPGAMKFVDPDAAAKAVEAKEPRLDAAEVTLVTPSRPPLTAALPPEPVVTKEELRSVDLVATHLLAFRPGAMKIFREEIDPEKLEEALRRLAGVNGVLSEISTVAQMPVAARIQALKILYESQRRMARMILFDEILGYEYIPDYQISSEDEEGVIVAADIIPPFLLSAVFNASGEIDFSREPETLAALTRGKTLEQLKAFGHFRDLWFGKKIEVVQHALRQLGMKINGPESPERMRARQRFGQLKQMWELLMNIREHNNPPNFMDEDLLAVANLLFRLKTDAEFATFNKDGLLNEKDIQTLERNNLPAAEQALRITHLPRVRRLGAFDEWLRRAWAQDGFKDTSAGIRGRAIWERIFQTEFDQAAPVPALPAPRMSPEDVDTVVYHLYEWMTNRPEVGIGSFSREYVTGGDIQAVSNSGQFSQDSSKPAIKAFARLPLAERKKELEDAADRLVDSARELRKVYAVLHCFDDAQAVTSRAVPALEGGLLRAIPLAEIAEEIRLSRELTFYRQRRNPVDQGKITMITAELAAQEGLVAGLVPRFTIFLGDADPEGVYRTAKAFVADRDAQIARLMADKLRKEQEIKELQGGLDPATDDGVRGRIRSEINDTIRSVSLMATQIDLLNPPAVQDMRKVLGMINQAGLEKRLENIQQAFERLKSANRENIKAILAGEDLEAVHAWALGENDVNSLGFFQALPVQERYALIRKALNATLDAERTIAPSKQAWVDVLRETLKGFERRILLEKIPFKVSVNGQPEVELVVGQSINRERDGEQSRLWGVNIKDQLAGTIYFAKLSTPQIRMALANYQLQIRREFTPEQVNGITRFVVASFRRGEESGYFRTYLSKELIAKLPFFLSLTLQERYALVQSRMAEQAALDRQKGWETFTPHQKESVKAALGALERAVFQEKDPAPFVAELKDRPRELALLRVARKADGGRDMWVVEQKQPGRTWAAVGNFSGDQVRRALTDYKLLDHSQETLAAGQARGKPVGGINMSDENLTMGIKMDGQGMPLPAQFQSPAVVNIPGLSPIIREIAPISPATVPALTELLPKAASAT